MTAPTARLYKRNTTLKERRRIMRPLETLTAVGGGLTPRNLLNANRERQSGSGFELIFAEAQRRESAQAAHNVTRSEPAARTNSPPERPHRTERRNDEAQTQHAQQNQETAPANEAETANYAQVTEPAAENAEAHAPVDTPHEGQTPHYVPDGEILAVVAEILQTTQEAVQTLMTQANVQPQDLAEPQAVTALLQEVYEAETTAQLLTEPEFPAAYKAINEAMVQMTETAETKVAVQAAPEAVQTANYAAATNTQATASIPVVEGLQYATEDGELVVTDKPLEEEIVAETERPAASSSSAQAAAQTATSNVPGEAQAQVLDTAPVITMEDAPQDLNAIPTQPLESMVETRVQSVQAAQQTQQAQDVNPADVINQIMSQIRVHTGEQVTEMRLTLRPESLGDIVLRVLTQNGIVTAQFVAESQRVREALESNFNQLRDALSEQGIAFSELSVSVRQNGAQSVNAALEEETMPAQSIDFDNTINLTA
jgi:flagellar hook-length control protein FliK